MRLRPRSPVRFLLALVAAVLLWYALAGHRRESISVRGATATLTLVNLPRELVLVSDVPDTVSLRLRGPLSTVAGATEGLEVLLDLADAQPGVRTLSVDPDAITLPPEVAIVSVDPSEVTIELERLASRLLPVRAEIEGAPAPGFIVAQVVTSPNQILIRGPGTRLRDLSEVRTSAISVEGLSTAVLAETRLVLDDALVRPVTTEPVVVEVDIQPEPDPTPTPTPSPRPGRR